MNKTYQKSFLIISHISLACLIPGHVDKFFESNYLL